MLPTVAPRSPSVTSADAYLDELLDLYLPAYTDYIREYALPVNLCIHASRITSAVLTHFGVRGVVPVGVDVVAAHPSGARFLGSGMPPWEVAEKVATVGVMGTDAEIGDGWSGHVVSYVQAVQGRRRARLVDPTAEQFSAPALGINVAAKHLDATDAFLKGRPLVASTDGAAIWLKRNARLDGFRGQLADEPVLDLIAAELVANVEAAMLMPGRRAA